jgi:hypothetical protein
MQKPGAGESLPEGGRVDPAKNPLLFVKVDGGDFLFSSDIPLFAKVFNFGQFRHAAGMINAK